MTIQIIETIQLSPDISTSIFFKDCFLVLVAVHRDSFIAMKEKNIG